MKQLLQEALDALGPDDSAYREDRVDAVMSKLRAAIATPEQEPVGYVFEKRDIIGSVIGAKGEWAPHETPLYTKPQQSVELTRFEIFELIPRKGPLYTSVPHGEIIDFAEAILAAQKAKSNVD